MKVIIWIIVLALIGWGIWWFVGNDDLPAADNGANAAGALDLNLNADVDSGASTDDPADFEDKG
jgi:hypothetical protein